MPVERVTSAIVTQQGAIYTATCPEFGTVEQGASEAEAIANLRILSSAYLSIVSLNSGSIQFNPTYPLTAPVLTLQPIEMSAWAMVRILERMGFSQVQGLMVMQRNLFDTTSTCVVPLHHRTLKVATLQAMLEQSQIPTQDLVMNL